MNNKFEGKIENLTLNPLEASSIIDSIPNEELPSFFGICSAKNLPLEVWNEIAIALYDLKKIKEFLELMNFLISDQMEKHVYNDDGNASKKIRILNTLTTYYLNLAANENDIKQKGEYFTSAIVNINKSNRIKLEESSSFALKGYLLFFQGDHSKNVISYFNQNPNCVVSILGTAILEFSLKNYEESLKLFKTALKLSPSMPANARLGLAYNFFFLEKYNMAYFTFQRILKMDPKNVDALLGLAVLEFKNENYKKYHEYLETSYALDKCSPFLLLHIAEFFLFRKDLEKARSTAIKGYKYLKFHPKFVIDPNHKVNEMKKKRNDFYEAKSRFLYILGYYHHFKNKYDQAFKYYDEAVQAYPLNLSAQYSLGQICISQKNFAKALKCFEIVNENSKDQNEECLKILGYLYLKNSKRLEAIEYYQKSLKFDPNDFETWIEYASLQEHYDTKVSLEAYEKALEVIIQRQNDIGINEETGQPNKVEEIKPELLNNIGVLKMKLERFDDSKESFQKAYDICIKSEETRLENGHCRYLLNTIQFNMGILYEEMKKLREANESYKAIITLNPFYTDAYLRLSYLALKRGSSVKALEYCKQAIDKIEQSKKIKPDLALCLKGYIFQEIGDTTNARQAYESVKKKYGLDDPFADFSIMKMLYEESCELRDQNSDQKRYLKSLIESSKLILNFDEFNYQAASIVAIVMAELGHFREAKEIFNQIEYNQQNTHMLVNVAHLEYLKGNYENSIKIYTSYLQKTSTPDEYIEMCIVINFYLLKKNDEALKIMKKLVLRNPESLIHRYNLNVLLHNSAQAVLEQKDRKKEQTEKSIEYLKKIQPIYEYLFKNHYARKTRDDLEKCDDSRRKSKRLMEKIRESSENKLNYIQSHQDRFEDLIKADEEMIKRKLLSAEEKKKKFEEMRKREIKEKEEKDRIAQEKTIKQQQLAEEQMKSAMELQEQLRNISENQQNRKNNRKDKAKIKKKGKRASEDDDVNSDNALEKMLGSEVEENSEDQDDFINNDDVIEDNEAAGSNDDDQEEKIEKVAQDIKMNKKSLKRKFKDIQETDENKEKNEEEQGKAKKKRKIVKHFGGSEEEEEEEEEEERIFHDDRDSPKAKEKERLKEKDKEKNKEKEKDKDKDKDKEKDKEKEKDKDKDKELDKELDKQNNKNNHKVKEKDNEILKVKDKDNDEEKEKEKEIEIEKQKETEKEKEKESVPYDPMKAGEDIGEESEQENTL